MTGLLNNPDASLNKKITINNMVILVMLPLINNAPSTNFSRNRFTFLLVLKTVQRNADDIKVKLRKYYKHVTFCIDIVSLWFNAQYFNCLVGCSSNLVLKN
jgi:hypothetical protein